MNLLEQFINFLQNQKRKPSFLTVKNYKADITQFISWFEKEFITPFDPSKVNIQTLEQYKKARNLSPVSLERHTSSLRKFFGFLKLQGISQDPLEKRTLSDVALAEADPWMLKNFKSFLYENKKSYLTIKNYIIDIKSFFGWLEEVTLVKNVWETKDKNLLDKINFSVIEEYKQRLISSKFSPLTVNRKLSSLRNYISWAKKEGFISEHSENSAGQNVRKSELQTVRTSGSLSYPSIPNYSSFPPIRLAQKSLKGANFLFDSIAIISLAKAIDQIQYLFWKSTGKKIFKKNVILGNVKDDIAANIKKELYAPLDISLGYLPLHKKIHHYLRHKRPKWYKKYHSYSITHYFHFAILIVVCSAFGFGIYSGIFTDMQNQNPSFAQISALSAPPRALSFEGKLTDASNNPITKATDVVFSIYNNEASNNNSFLWKETNTIIPDSDGNFSTLLGKINPIPSTLFNQSSQLFLGIRVGESEELIPRQTLPTVPFAGNSETLQGLQPITNSETASNVVLTLDSSGNLSILDSRPHTFQTIRGNLILSGNLLTLTSAPGSNSNVEIDPDGTGKIDVKKPIENSLGLVEFEDLVSILATTSAQSALTINQTSTGPLFTASSSGVAKFTVDNDGTGIFAGDLQINGGYLTSTAAIFSFLDSNVKTLNLASEATSILVGSSSGTLILQNANTTVKGNITLGDSDSDTLTFTGRVAKDSSLIPITTDGTNSLGSSSLAWDNAYINNIYALKLNIQDSQEATATAQIFNTNTGEDADGLVIKLGNISASAVASANHFINFETSGIGIVGSIQGNGGKGVTYATSGIADFAEYLKKDKNQTIEYGAVVCLSDNGLVAPCNNSNSKIVGVVSERPAFLGGENLGASSIAVGLVGQVETLVSIKNGPIKAGGVLSSSDIPGVATKATKAGLVVGKALKNLERIDESRVVGFYDPDSKEYRSKANFPDIPIKPNIVRIVKIPTLVSVSWHDPGAYLTSAGELQIDSQESQNSSVRQAQDDPEYAEGSSLKTQNYSLKFKTGELIDRVGAFAELAAANIRTGFIQAQEIVTQSLIVTSDSLIVNGQNLKDYITILINESPLRQDFGGQAGIVSPVVRTNTLLTNIISPLSDDSNISVSLHDSKFVIHDSTNASGSAIAAIDNEGNASFSGQLTASSGQFENASVSGTLRAGSILADSIEGLEDLIDISSYSAQLAFIPDLSANTAQFNQGLMVFGSTSLYDLSVVNNLSIGGSMFIADNSIEVLGTNLSLQSLRQGGLSIMGGLVYIDTDGNLTAKANVTIEGKLAVNVISPLPASDLVINNSSGSGVLSINQKGDIIASGSGTFSKLNLSLVHPALAISSTQFLASSSAGVAKINPYYTEVTIKNALVTENSVIYITPVGTPSAQTPFLMRQKSTDFTVGVESPTSKPIPFNWLIVN